MSANKIDITMNSGDDFNCPLCSELIFNEYIFQQCPHVIFAYDIAQAEWVYYSQEYAYIIEFAINIMDRSEVFELDIAISMLSRYPVNFYNLLFYYTSVYPIYENLMLCIDSSPYRRFF